MKNQEVKEKKTTKKQTEKVSSSKKESPKKEKTKKEEETVIIKEIPKNNEQKKSSSKKKIKMSDVILILGLVIVIVLGCFIMKGEKVEPKYELPLTLTGENGLHQLTYQEYQEKIDNNEHFVVIIERATCSHCVTFMPIAEKFATNYNVPMYYVDTDTFSSEDWSGFEKSNTYFKKSKGNWGTPTTIVLAGNESVDYIEGVTAGIICLGENENNTLHETDFDIKGKWKMVQ